MPQTPNGCQTGTLPVRHQDLHLAAFSEDSDRLLHEVLIRFCSVFLDQGYAQWKLPHRSTGFFHAFISLFSSGGFFTKRWLRPVSRELQRIHQAGMSAMDSLEESLSLLGITSDEKESFVRGSLLALRGWAGMIWQTEERPDRVYIPSRHGTLIEFLAIRLILERYALQWLSRETMDYKGPLYRLREFIGTHYSERDTEASVEQIGRASCRERV